MSEVTDAALAEAARIFRGGDQTGALRMLESAAWRDPGHAEANLELARLLTSMRRAAEAEAVLRRAVAASPAHFGLLTNLGVLLCQTGRAAEGADILLRGVATAPEEAIAHFNLANALKSLDRDEDAVEAYRRAIALNPAYAPAYTNLGNTLLQLGHIEEGAAAYQRATELRRAPGTKPTSGDDLSTRTTRSKLRHDIEQLDYLRAKQVIGPEHDATRRDYQAALDALPPGSDGVVDLPPSFPERLAPTYNRLWHKYEAPALSRAINPALDRDATEADYFRNHPGITAVDNLLTPEALAGLRRFCLESTFWFGFKYANGYLGAFMADAFWCPLMAQVTEELRRAFPGIFHDHTLRKCWAFKYDSQLSGIPMHADFAAINVNFWITPDEANLDPESGGLVVWDKEAPRDWDFSAYNRDVPRMKQFLADSNARAVRVPHRQNRALIFNSDLFHETDKIVFKDGYENRRINITLLYGTRGG